MAHTKAQLRKFEIKTKKHISDAKKKLLHAEKKIHNYMSKHPEKAAIVAAALGAAIGAAVTAALRRKKKR